MSTGRSPMPSSARRRYSSHNNNINNNHHINTSHSQNNVNVSHLSSNATPGNNPSLHTNGGNNISSVMFPPPPAGYTPAYRRRGTPTNANSDGQPPNSHSIFSLSSPTSPQLWSTTTTTSNNNNNNNSNNNHHVGMTATNHHGNNHKVPYQIVASKKRTSNIIGRSSLDSLNVSTNTINRSSSKNHDNHSKTNNHHKNNTNSSTSKSSIDGEEEEDNKDGRDDMESSTFFREGEERYLRQLVLDTLLLNNNATTNMVVTYASLLYTRTQNKEDALLLARACCQSQQHRRAIHILEEANLLSSGNNLHAILLASSSWCTLGEWEEALYLLEKASIYPSPLEHQNQHNNNNNNDDEYLSLIPPQLLHPTFHNSKEQQELESGEDERWLSWAHQYNEEHDDDGSIHPVALLCAQRGICYEELSNPTRACHFFQMALRIDVKCLMAWEYICQKHLLHPTDQFNFINHQLDFSSTFSWLKPLYLAQLSSCSSHPPYKSNNQPNISPLSANPETQSQHQQHQQQQSPVAEEVDFLSSRLNPSNLNDGKSNNIDLEFNDTSNDKMDYKNGNEEKIETQQEEDEESQYQLEIRNAFYLLQEKHHLPIHRSPELTSLAAIRAYRSNNLQLALKYCLVLNALDPLCPTAVMVHISTLTALKHKRSLFSLAHSLVNAHPNHHHHSSSNTADSILQSSVNNSRSAAAWFAVGCYYYVCQRYDLAQRHFCRATRLAPKSAECWIAFGCAFAACDESDQALASYRAAQRYHPSSHIPLLYMGMEYMRTNHTSLAGHFLKSAANACSSSDPLVWNELGVWHHKREEWKQSIQMFNHALRLIIEGSMDGCGLNLIEHHNNHKTAATDHHYFNHNENEHPYEVNDNNDDAEEDYKDAYEHYPHETAHVEQPNLPSTPPSQSLSDIDCVEYCQDIFWEPTIFNLGQSYRKSKQYDFALVCFEKCVSLCPGNAAGYTALAFTKHLMGDIDGAIECYHQVLSRKPDDTFASEMLHRALQDAIRLPDALFGDEIKFDNTSMMTSSISKGMKGNSTKTSVPRRSLPAFSPSPQRMVDDTSMMNMSATMMANNSISRIGGVNLNDNDDDFVEEASHFTFDTSDVDVSMR